MKIINKFKIWYSTYVYKNRLKKLLFSNILDTRQDIILILLNSTRNKTRLPVGQLKNKAKLLDFYTSKLRNINNI